jgi:hypothetical protein
MLPADPEPVRRISAAAPPMLKTESDFWLAWLGRAGYAGRGLFYVIVGICALAAALLAGHNSISEPSILKFLLGHIWGILIIALIGIAFAANCLWFLYVALLRKEHPSRYVPAWARHIANLAMSILFAVLAVIAGALLLGWSPGRIHAIEQITALAMHQLGWVGRIGAGVVGLVVIGAALFQFYEAWAEDFRGELDLNDLPHFLQKIIIQFARFGLTARAAVIALIGLFLLVAAFKGDPRKALGPTQSLQRLEYEPFGPILLGIIALGLMAFGLWLLVEAWYRKIEKDAR